MESIGQTNLINKGQQNLDAERDKRHTFPRFSSLPTNTNAPFSSLMSRDHYPFGQQFVSSSSRRDDEVNFEHGDHYFFNSSTTRLAGTSPFVDHSGESPFHSFFILYTYTRDAESNPDPYGRSYNPSIDSHSTATSISPFASLGSAEHYPAWSTDRQIPMSAEEIEDIFLDLTQKFGFQRDSMRNMVLPFSLY